MLNKASRAKSVVGLTGQDLEGICNRLPFHAPPMMRMTDGWQEGNEAQEV